MRPELTKMTTLPQSWWVKYRLRMMLQWLKLSKPSNLTRHTQDVRGGEEPVYFEEDHILSTHCESLRKKNNSLLPKGGQGNSSTIASPDLGGISLTSILTHKMAIHFLGHLPQDNSHSELKNSGQSITCNKSRGRGRGVGRQRTELLRTYSCYKAISEKNWNIKN